MDGFVTHIANDDLVFIIVHVADVASLAISTFPREPLHKLHIQGRLRAVAMEHFLALAASDRFSFFGWDNLLAA